jgi:hypothetical protein
MCGLGYSKQNERIERVSRPSGALGVEEEG